MNKAITLEHLHQAKKAHISWVSRAKALIEGLPVQKEQIPVDCTACKFGEWFYSDAQSLKSIPGMDYLKRIEEEHFKLHDVYMKIFKIYFDESNISFLSKLFGSKKRVSEEEQQEAEAFYEELREVSKTLVDFIDKLEKRLHVLHDGRFSA